MRCVWRQLPRIAAAVWRSTAAERALQTTVDAVCARPSQPGPATERSVKRNSGQLFQCPSGAGSGKLAPSLPARQAEHESMTRAKRYNGLPWIAAER